jgi:O-palmitoleoyl-L-serine hydrolase
LGTSANAPATVDKDGILSDQASQNPDFYTWNRVQLPYCGGDLHSGTRMTNTSGETWGLWFSGHNIISAMYDVLTAQAGMGAATDIIITGGSAGAVGSWLNTEYTQTRFPSARVVNLPNAGYNTVEEQYPLALGEEKPAALANMSLVWQSKIPPLCDAAFTNVSEKYKCLMYAFRSIL